MKTHTWCKWKLILKIIIYIYCFYHYGKLIKKKKKITELRQNGVTKPEKVINNSSEF